MISDYKIRENIEIREESLSPFAVKSKNSKGRLVPEESDPIRTCFQKDRDRIIHSKAFRRLKHKTQVFIMPEGDHFVTRLTHTLEVAQISRTISRSLNLNEDLTEAIALGHDLGHTPFGHAGEKTLARLYGSFRHNEQSLRIVDKIEDNGKGLNLTYEVRHGILHHSKSNVSMFDDTFGKNSTLEGDVVKLSDAIAYINHDIADAIRYNIITEEQLPESTKSILGNTHGKRINTMVTDIIENSWNCTGFVTNITNPEIKMSDKVKEASDELRKFMFENVYNVENNVQNCINAEAIIEELYNYFIQFPNKMPKEYYNETDNINRCVVDYISGMTDQFALNIYQMIRK